MRAVISPVSGSSVTVPSPLPSGSPDTSEPERETSNDASWADATSGASKRAHAAAVTVSLPRFVSTVRFSSFLYTADAEQFNEADENQNIEPPDTICEPSGR